MVNRNSNGGTNAFCYEFSKISSDLLRLHVWLGNSL